MQSTILDCRTVAIVKELTVEQKQGANGAFEAKSMLVRIAVDRPYKVTRQENGKTISEHPTDFWLAKFTGPQAQAFNDYCSAKKEDGKLQSRRLLMSGNFEKYPKPKTQHAVIPVVINGLQYNIEADVPVDNNEAVIFIVDEFKFLDGNPQNRQQGGVTAASVTPVGVATPVVGQAVAGQTVAGQAVVGQQAAQTVTYPAAGQTITPAAQPTTPVAQPQVIQPAAQPVVTQPQAIVAGAVVNGFDAGAMNVPEGFSANGQTAPF